MIVTVLSRTRMSSMPLPDSVSGGHWLVDADLTRLAFIEGKDGAWTLDPQEGITPRGHDLSSGPLELDPSLRTVLNLEGAGGERWSVLCYPGDAGMRSNRTYGFTGDLELTVGRDPDNAIVYATRFVSGHHASLRYERGTWQVTDLGSANGVFVNGWRIDAQVPILLSAGDIVSILDLNITVGRGLISCNNPARLVTVSPDLVPYEAPRAIASDAGHPRHGKAAEPDYFFPALRFARAIEPKRFVVDAPPAPDAPEETPLLMRIGPSLVMGLASAMSAMVSLTTLMGTDGSLIRAVPMVVMAVAMLLGSVLWPILSSRSEAKRRELKEAKRRASYSQYLSGVLGSIAEEERLQREILEENRLTVRACLDRALTDDVRLWDRTPLHADYLELRIGTGEEPLRAEVAFPEKHFTLEDDEIRRAVDEQAAVPRALKGVPLAFSLLERPIAGVIGDPVRVRPFVRGLMVQLAALVSYENLKIVLLADEVEREEWDFARHLPHCRSNDRRARFVAFGAEEAAELGLALERVLEERRAADRKAEPRDAAPYYVVFCTSETLADRADIVRTLTAERENLGVSLIACAREMRDLPRACRSVMGLTPEGSYLLDREDPRGERRAFDPDILVEAAEAAAFARAVSRRRLDIKIEDRRVPSRLGFLEMERAGNVEHLSVASRWERGNASSSLAAPVGVDAQGDPFMLNLHEKFHGPHGLIAGTTGSGKSEFIITYILSMALTYSPNDVAFVLIDYKGGGLARAFDNEHVRLPHLAGVITNLDGAAITRSLASIKSELKRRQALFNRARDIAGGDNVDIYDYLDLFRQGRVEEPCPHLFIVADEFAELKQQEPEFMDELISAARIGRSLGVHLILATQKPSGVVNDQIWSNSRFKVCLKVADEADSREMIRRPDAASITQAGRFYLLVGYNEYFALGQAAYAGTRYVPSERFCPSVDDAVTLISDTGRALVTVKPQRDAAGADDTPEIVAVLKLIEREAARMGLSARRLWLDPVPEVVRVDELVERYDEAPGGAITAGGAYELAPIIGEMDDPEHQRRALLRLPISLGGNALVYGTSDSGVELVLHAALASMLMTFGPDRLNVYALDFGTESLRAFAEAPQVGDVVCAADEERVRRFMDFIEAEMVRRRGEMAPFGGNFDRYRAAGGTRPAIVVLLNDIAALMEGYPKLEDRLVRFAREAGGLGVHLVMTAANTGSVRFRMRQSFRQVMAVNLADAAEYGSVFGMVRGVPQPRGYGRGTARTEEGIFEFQAARLTEGGDDYAWAARLSRGLAERAEAEGWPVAPPVPTVPERVEPSMLLREACESEELPVGVFEDTLERAVLDFGESAMARVLFQRRKSGVTFMRALVDVAVGQGAWDVSVLDVAGLLGDAKPAGCRRATRKAERAGEILAEVLAGAEGGDGAADVAELFGVPGLDAASGADAGERAAGRKQLVLVSGMARLLSGAAYDRQSAIKDGLRELMLSGDVRILLVDAVSDASYTYEDWFKAQLTSKAGLWVGPGLDAQSAISTNYTPGLVPDAEMREGRGYLVEGGTPRLVRLATEG